MFASNPELPTLGDFPVSSISILTVGFPKSKSYLKLNKVAES